MNTISFPNMFNKNDLTSMTNISYGYESIHNSLSAIFNVNKGELLGDPSYGTKIREKLFDLNTPTNMGEIKQMIILYIERFIPQIYVNSSMIKIYTDGDSHYKITISYKIKNSGEQNDYEVILSN